MSNAAGFEERNWSEFYRAARGQPPRDTLLQALERFDATGSPEQGRFAIDLGCGAGRDTFALLQRGWRVLAVDGKQEAINLLQQDAPPEALDMLETQVATFEEIVTSGLPPADLINASFSLPFCRPRAFAALLRTIVTALPPGGRFAGQLFGLHDTWASNPALTFHSREEASALFASFEVEQFREQDEDGKTATGEAKHWHVYWIVARKRDSA